MGLQSYQADWHGCRWGSSGREPCERVDSQDATRALILLEIEDSHWLPVEFSIAEIFDGDVPALHLQIGCDAFPFCHVDDVAFLNRVTQYLIHLRTS